jgi:hypothetical protein
MGIYLKNSSGWKNLAEVYLKNSSGWKKIKTAYLKTSSGWKLLFSASLTPEIESGVLITSSTNSTTYLTTLTGKNFHWFNSTGLTYKFKYSAGGATYYDLTGATTISNPSVGSNNTVTYALSTSDVQPNVDNYYKFIVTATNSTYDTSAASEDVLIIYGIRDLDVTNSSHDITSLAFSWSGGMYANGFIYQYREYVDSTNYGFWSTAAYTENYYVTLTGLTAAKQYQIRVKGITGASTANPGYSGNWAYQVGTTDTAPTPTVTAYPTLTGTAVAKTSVSSSNGAYNNNNPSYSIQSRIIGVTDPALIVQGDTTDYGAVLSSTSLTYFQSYTITQSDATAPSYYIFARDSVIGLDGVTYYFYSTGVKSTMGTVTDDFNRTVSGGIGTMSSGFTYSGGYTSPSWSVNGSSAVTTANPGASSGPDAWGLRSIEMGGDTDVSMSIGIPSGQGGIGVAFWVTSNSQWWSAICAHDSSVLTTYACTGSGGSGSSYPSNVGTGAGQNCNVTSTSVYDCNQSGGSGSSYPSNVGDGSGQNCNVSSSTEYACDSYGGSGYSYPSNVGSGAGQNCNVVAVTTYACNQVGGSSTSYPGPESPETEIYGICNLSSSTTYPCNTGSASSSQSDPGPNSNSAGGVCNKSTSTGYAFQAVTYSPLPSSSASTCNAANFGKYQSGSAVYLFGGLYNYNYCNSYTLYTWSNRSYSGTTTYTWNRRSFSGTTTYYWNKRSTSGTTTYSWSKRSTSPTTTYYWSTQVGSTTTYYNTYLRIYESNGSSVSLKSDNLIENNSISYISVYGLSLSTSGNSITAALKNSSGGVIGSTVYYTASSPTKTDYAGASGFGLSKGYSPAAVGYNYDNLSIS